MRDISSASLTKLATTHGTQPTIIIDIQWGDGSSVARYGDIAIPEQRVSGTIQQVSGIDDVITIQGVSQGTTGDSQQVSQMSTNNPLGSIFFLTDSTSANDFYCFVEKSPVQLNGMRPIEPSVLIL